MDDLDRIFRRLVQNLRSGYPQYLSNPFSTEELYQVIVPYRHNRQELGIDTNQDYEMALLRLLSGERGYLVVDRDMRESLTREIESSNPDTSLFRAFNDRTISVSTDAIALLDPAARTSDDARMAPPVSRSQATAPPRSAANNRSPAVNPAAPQRPRSGGMGTPPSPSQSSAIPIPGMPLPPAPLPPLRQASTPAPSYASPPESLPPLPPPRPIAPVRPPPGAPAAPGSRSAGTAAPGTAAPTPGFTGFRGGHTNSPSSDMASTRRSITAAALGGRCRYCSGTLPDGRQLTFCPHCGQDLTVQQCPACSTELELGWKFCTTCGRGVAQS